MIKLVRPLGRMSLLALLIITWSVATGCSQQEQSDPKALLQKIEEHYNTLESFDLEATITTNLDRGGQNRTMSFPIRYVKGTEGRLRIEVNHAQMGLELVSDGSTTWTFMPSAGEYTKEQMATLGASEEAGPNSGPSAEFIDMAEQLIRPMATITDDMKKVEHMGVDTLEMGGNKHVVEILEVTYHKDPGMSQAEVSPTSYWVDADNGWVLKQQYTVSMEDPRMGGKASMKQSIQLDKIKTELQFTEETFSFQPPRDAKEVDRFDSQGAGGRTAAKNQPASNFELPTLEGETVSLDQYRGNVVLIDFWATWCAPCRQAHPHIQKLYDEYKDDGLVVLGVNTEDEQTAREYMEEEGYTFKTLIDADNSVARRYGVRALPNVYIINREGEIAEHLVGYRSESMMREALKSAGL